MGRAIKSTAGIGLMVGMAIALTPSAATARTCRAAPLVAASNQLQEFRVEKYNLSLMIPSNYRSMLRSGGHITFHDPANFALIQCLVRTGEYAEVAPYVALEVYEGASAEADLVNLLRSKRPWLDYYNPDYQAIEFAGQTGLQYTYTNELYQLAIANISFLSEDGRTLLTLTGPADHPILVNALSTITSDAQN
jgi:hypothetical protein